MKERLIYDKLIIGQSFFYGGYYEKRNYYCYFYEPVEVFNKAIVVAILIIAFIIYCLYRKNKKRR